MTKIEYLKLCILDKEITNYRRWYISLLSILTLKDTVGWDKDYIRYSLVPMHDGLYFIDVEEDTPTLVKIEDYIKDQPLFDVKEPIEVDSTWLSSIDKPIKSRVGVLLFNNLALHSVVGDRIPYINKKISPSDLSKIFVNKVREDNELTPTTISVKHMIDIIDRVYYLNGLAHILSVAATPKSITKPKGIDEYRDSLLKEYKDKLDDPTKVVEFESKLLAKDKEYLKDDPAAKNLFGRKAFIARKKMFLSYGDTMDFIPSDKSSPIINPLDKGVDTSPENFPKYMNDQRFGSHSRGSSTQLSGYTYKILQRSLSGLKISSTPCDTTKGLKRPIHEGNYTKLIDRYIRVGNQWVNIPTEEEAKKYIGKVVEFRSAMECTSKGNSLCYQCLSETYKNQEGGITNIAANISSVLMSLFLKMMHGNIVETETISMNDLVT